MAQIESSRLNIEVLKNLQITSRESMIIKSFDRFYEDIGNVNLFIPIVNSTAKISIRLIDHFVTKYSKTHKVSYKLKENNIEQNINIHSSYKQQLKIYQKKYFDPFSRGDRIPYFMSNACVITTIGQLNFFAWFFTKRVYDYIVEHHDAIENDMNKKNKCDKKKYLKEPKQKKIKTQKITQSPVQSSNYNSTHNIHNTTLNFSEPKMDKIVVSFSFM